MACACFPAQVIEGAHDLATQFFLKAVRNKARRLQAGAALDPLPRPTSARCTPTAGSHPAPLAHAAGWPRRQRKLLQPALAAAHGCRLQHNGRPRGLPQQPAGHHQQRLVRGERADGGRRGAAGLGGEQPPCCWCCCYCQERAEGACTTSPPKPCFLVQTSWWLWWLGCTCTSSRARAWSSRQAASQAAWGAPPCRRGMLQPLLPAFPARPCSPAPYKPMPALIPLPPVPAQLPNLLELHDAVLALPRIRAYRESEQCLPTAAPMLL